jgi:carboxypeptidase family protein
MRLRLLAMMAGLLAATTTHAACVGGVCIPWMDAPNTVRVGLRVLPAMPAGGTLSVRGIENDRQWSTSASAAQIAELRTLILPPGSYLVTVELQRHRPAARELVVAGGAFDAGVLAPTRLPRIEGEVRGPDGKALAGVRIALSPSGPAVTTGASGRFAIDVAAAWPSELIITRTGYGARIIPLDRNEQDLTVKPVTLRRGATLRVRIARGKETGPIELEAGVLTDGSRPVWTARRTLAPGQSSVAFDDLDRDVYAVLLSGREPLQKMLVRAVINQQKNTIDVSLPDTRVRGAITLGGEPLPGASVELHRQGVWTTSLVSDANGELASAAWENGELDALVSGGGLPSKRLIRLRAGAGLNIDLPSRTLRGAIVDEGGSHVAGARVALEVEQDEMHGFIRTQTDLEGRYAFGGVDTGRFRLHADAEGYLRIDPIDVVVTGDQTVVEQPIVVESAHARPLEIVDRDGRPVAGAAVACAVDGRIRATAMTDANGRATIGTPAAPSVLFVIPPEGSLAVVRLASSRDEATRIAIPPGEAKLDITALAPGDSPLAGVSLLMRFNGELFTPEIARELRLWHRSSLRTGDDGRTTLTQIPTGYYEFWPYQSAEEAEMLIESSVAMAAPIALHVVGGENEVKVRFEAR